MGEFCANQLDSISKETKAIVNQQGSATQINLAIDSSLIRNKVKEVLQDKKDFTFKENTKNTKNQKKPNLAPKNDFIFGGFLGADDFSLYEGYI